MKILITGASGFLGGIIYKKLHDNILISLGRQDAEIICDLSQEIPKLPLIDLVIHLAGKAHVVPKTEFARHQFFDVNVKGSVNLVTGLEQNEVLPKSFVFVSSVSVYGLFESELIKENSPLNAKDPYGESKIEAEKIVQEWCAKNNVICTILRLPLIAGPNPPGNLKSMITGIKKGYYFNIAGGKARKSVVLAEDVATIIPKAAQVGGVYNLTDGYHPSFAELSELIANQLDKKKPADIPGWLATLMAKAGDLIGPNAPINSSKLSKITSDLTFDDTKARQFLGWSPTPVLKGFKIM